MPSVSTKQAHLMSAVAHGWKPTGSAAGLPVSVAKKFHAADAGHKYGAGMHGGKGRPYPKHNYEYGGAIAIARKYSPRRRYADGGGDGDYVSPTGYDLPPEITRGRSQSRPPDPDFDSAWRRRVTLPMALAPQSDDSDDLRQQLMQEGMRRRGFQDGGGADDDFDTRWQDENWQLMPQQYGDRQYKPILDATLANRATQYPQYTPPPKGKEFNIPTKAEFEALLRRQGYDIGGGTPSPDMDDPSVPRMLRPGTSFNQRWPDRDLPVQASFDDRFGSPSFSQRWNDRTLPAQAAGVI